MGLGRSFRVGALLACLVVSLGAAEGLLRPKDTVAFVGGEDLLAAVATGRLEMRLVQAWPDHQLRFRSLAWEGDTVFQQSREPGYPALERQLDEIGATVVVVQFGQMESLGGEAGVSAFVAAYETLIGRLSDGGRRRILLLEPTPIRADAAGGRFRALPAYASAVAELARRQEVAFLSPASGVQLGAESYRNGVHLTDAAHAVLADRLARLLGAPAPASTTLGSREVRLLSLIREKDRLWFNYVRPTNLAFFIGLRTEQPFGRDHRDFSVMLYPEESKRWLPLIAAEEEAIWSTAREASRP